MRTCEACGRDFKRRRFDSMTCPYCGYNTVPRGMPRTEKSMRQIEKGRRYLGWDEGCKDQ